MTASNAVKAVGIIAEFNPFHAGHKFLIDSVKKAFPQKPIVCAMSGNFVQRGEFARWQKYARARTACEAGADLVFEIPAPYSCLSAEAFASAGVDILAKTGLCDTLAFGSEVTPASVIEKTAANLLNPKFQTAFSEALLTGKAGEYPRIREKVYENLFGKTPVLRSRNAALAVEYARRVISQGYQLDLFAVERSCGGFYQSASSIRERLKSGEGVDACPALSSETRRVLQNEETARRAPVLLSYYTSTLRYLLTVLSPAELQKIYGFAPLSYRGAKAAENAADPESILSALACRQMTNARLSRALLALLLQIPKGAEQEPCSYTNVLAMNDVGRKLLARCRKASQFPVFTKPSHALRTKDKAVARAAAFAARCDRLYAAAFPGASCDAFFLKAAPERLEKRL